MKRWRHAHGDCALITSYNGVYTALSPLLQLFRVPPPNRHAARATDEAGLVLAFAAIGEPSTPAATWESWRIGDDVQRDTTLVRHGDFELVRRPIFTAMLVFSLGITLVPRPARFGHVRCCWSLSNCKSASSESPT